jgi:hypothetical protein
MEKYYVNEMLPNGDVSTVGLFYSRSEAENIAAQLRRVPEKSGCRYEIMEAVRRVLSVGGPQRSQRAPKE